MYPTAAHPCAAARALRCCFENGGTARREVRLRLRVGVGVVFEEGAWGEGQAGGKRGGGVVEGKERLGRLQPWQRA